MFVTSYEANMLLNKLTYKLHLLQKSELRNSVYICSNVEDKEAVKTKYDFKDACNKYAELVHAIGHIKHELNMFNTTNYVEYDMTIDMALTLIPFLKDRLYRLDELRNKDDFKRINSNGHIIDYEYANYDIEEANKEYENLYNRISKLELNLKLINITEKFEIDYDE